MQRAAVQSQAAEKDQEVEQPSCFSEDVQPTNGPFVVAGQIILSTLCAFLMKTRKVWLFSAHVLPLLARFCAVPPATLLAVSTFSVGLTGAGTTLFLLSHLFLPYRLAKAAYSQLVHMEVLFSGSRSSSRFFESLPSCSPTRASCLWAPSGV